MQHLQWKNAILTSRTVLGVVSSSNNFSGKSEVAAFNPILSQSV